MSENGLTPTSAEQASVLMKRGIALLNENTAESLPEALRFFNEALALRRALPASGNRGRPMCSRRAG
jgi:hypothetical protein